MIPYLATINPSGKADPVFPNFRVDAGVFTLLQRKRETGTGSPLPQDPTVEEGERGWGTQARPNVQCQID